VAVHMALFRGDTATAHSSILAYQGEDQTSLLGKLWRWTPPLDDSVNTGNFPVSAFTPRPLQPAPYDIFCSSHAHLADGRLLIAGGHDNVTAEIGTRHATIFDPHRLNTWPDYGWVPQDSMTNLRWYPSSTVLPDGKVITLNGSRYDQWDAFGGTDVQNHSTDSVFRATSTSTEPWDPAVYPAALYDFFRPTAREGMSMVSGINTWDAFIFGGRDTTSSTPYSSQLSALFEDQTNTTLDYSYHWSTFTNVGSEGSPAARAFHAALTIDVFGTPAMVILGGLDGSGPRSDVWCGSFTGTGGGWKWQPITTGNSPGPRYAQEAVYVPTLRRIYMFGGTDATNRDPHDADIWSMSTDSLLTHETATWARCTPVGTTKPAPRVQHTFVGDGSVLKNSTEGTLFRAFLYGGRTQWNIAPDQDTLWTVWFKGGPGDSVEWVPQAPHGSDPWPGFRARQGGLNDSKLGYQLVLAGGDVPGTSRPDSTLWIGAVPAACTGCPSDTLKMLWVLGHPMPRGTTGLRLSVPSEIFTNSVPEVYDPTHTAGTQTQWTPLATAFHRTEWYPFAFSLPASTAPSAKSIFVAGPDVNSWLLDLTAGAPAWVGYPRGDSTTLSNIGGSAAMYRPGKIMKCGSRDTEVNNYSTGATESVDLTTGSPSWKSSVNSMVHPRTVHNLVILPTGEVLVVGGLGYVNDFVDSLPVHQPEIWNPDYTDTTGFPGKQGYWYGANSGESHPLDVSSLDRDYHSNALLLPDGRVLCASGNTGNDSLPPGRTSHANDYVKVDIYSPPYLFVPGYTDSGAVRPTLTSPPAARMAWGNIFTLATPNDSTIQSVCLIKAGASTHGFNMDQRYIPLSFVRAQSPSRLLVTMPADSTIAPPGPYMLFMVDSSAASGTSRVPSVATWLFVGDKPGRDSADVVPPATSSDLAVVLSRTAVYLYWYAPADDSTLAASGRVTSYDGRYSLSALSDANWSSATPIPSMITPDAVGTHESQRVPSLSSCTSYHFGVRSKDDNANVSHTFDVQASTFCSGGGGGGGAAAQRVPRGSAGGVVVVETRRVGPNQWTVIAHDDSSVVGLGVPDSAGVYFQSAQGTNGWKTLGRLPVSPGDDSLGLCTLRDRRRIVLAGGWEIQAVAPGMLTGASPFGLTGALQGSLGSLGANFVAAGGSVGVGAGDSLVLTYQATSSASPDSNSWFLLVAHTGAGTFSARRTPPTQSNPLPVQFALHQNQPNPFVTATGIQFDMPSGGLVRLEVFDSQGRRVATLASQYFPAGYHTVSWNPASSSGGHLGPGVYFYRLQAGTFRDQRKMVLLAR